MSVRNEIMSNLKGIMENLNTFKKVKREPFALEKVKRVDLPCCYINSIKVAHNKELSTYTRQARDLYIEIYLVDKKEKSVDYHETMDNYIDVVFDELEHLMPDKLHEKALKTNVYVEDDVVNNDKDFDGFMIGKVVFIVSFYDKLGIRV